MPTDTPPTRLADYPADRLIEAIARIGDPALEALVWSLLEDELRAGQDAAGAPAPPAVPVSRRKHPRWLRLVAAAPAAPDTSVGRRAPIIQIVAVNARLRMGRAHDGLRALDRPADPPS